jgi:hypothetical protein
MNAVEAQRLRVGERRGTTGYSMLRRHTFRIQRVMAQASHPPLEFSQTADATFIECLLVALPLCSG